MQATVIPFGRVFRVNVYGDLERIASDAVPEQIKTFFTEFGWRAILSTHPNSKYSTHPNSKYVRGTDGNIHRMPKDYILKVGECLFESYASDLFYIE